MTRQLAILLNGRLADTVHDDVDGVSFVYDDDYLNVRANSVPLSLSMPMTQHQHPGGAIKTWLRGLLPDNPELLRY